MKRGLSIFFLLLTGLVFSYQDSDLDGVEDSKDKCPNTPFFVLVDKYGCPVKEIPPKRRRIKYYFKFGFSHSRDKNYEANYLTASIALSSKKFYVSLRTKYYTFVSNLGSGLGNTSFYISYRKSFDNVNIFPGLRVTLPTGEDNIVSNYLSYAPSVFLNYYVGNIDLFMYVERNFTEDLNKKDTWLFSGGFGYIFGEKLYSSLSVDFVESSLRNAYNTYANVYILYNVTSKIFTTVYISKGISEFAVDRTLSLKIGFRF